MDEIFNVQQLAISYQHKDITLRDEGIYNIKYRMTKILIYLALQAIIDIIIKEKDIPYRL